MSTVLGGRVTSGSDVELMASIHGSVISDLGVEVRGGWKVNDLPNRFIDLGQSGEVSSYVWVRGRTNGADPRVHHW